MKFKMFYPVKPVHLNQGFTGNAAYYQANGVNIVGHNGYDFSAFHGQPIYAAHAGTAYYEKDDDAGDGVVIVTDDKYEYKGKEVFFKSIYWHMCDPGVESKYASPIFKIAGGVNTGRGVHVNLGDLIGYADSTGLSTGDHLHFGLKPIVIGHAPMSGDAPDIGIGDYVNVEPNNGYLGAIDPGPYFNGFYATDAPALLSFYEKAAAIIRQYLLTLHA